MAANILAEFEDFYQPSDVTSTVAKPGLNPNTGVTNQQSSGSVLVSDLDGQVNDDFDDFGDFEAAPNRPKEPSRSAKQVEPAKVRTVKVRDENVLFDAEEDIDDDAEDDFGEFEGVATNGIGASQDHDRPTPVVASGVSSLIDFSAGVDDTATVDNSLRGSPSTSGFEKPTARKPHSQPKPAPAAASPPDLGYDDSVWDNVDELTPQPDAEHDTTKHTRLTSPAAESHVAPDGNLSPPPNKPAQGQRLSLEMLMVPVQLERIETPPPNVPPPAILLTLFSTALRKAEEQFLNPLSKQTMEAREKLLTSPEARQYLQALLSILVVLARILAGRKYRWKRDTVLAQSMRIGPASASGKSGGMKLTGIDKAESAREDREVAETVRLWRSQLGRLRSFANTAGGLAGAVDVAESYVVRTATSAEGASSSLKSCALCGLKRIERINKVDVDVQDSFHEWWIEHWGHKDCVQFWESQKNNLPSR